MLTLLAALELDGDVVDRENFRLPTLGPRLVSISHELYNGRGFAVVRGIDPQDYSVEDLTTVWMGIQAYIAEQRGRQDHKGNMLGKASSQFILKAPSSNTLEVHVVADTTTDAMIGHHRHSTSAIVSSV
jgi:hypothetical protein